MLASLLWAEHKFNYGITSLRNAKKISMPMFVVVGSSALITDRNIDAVKKIILDNHWVTIRGIIGYYYWLLSFCICQTIFTDIISMKHASANIVPKLQNFEQKQRRMDIGPEMLTTFNNYPDFLKKFTNHGCMVITIEAKGFQWVKTEKSMWSSWRHYSLFSLIPMAWCKMNSSHKVLRSIRNTIWKLCANGAKQFIRNA